MSSDDEVRESLLRVPSAFPGWADTHPGAPIRDPCRVLLSEVLDVARLQLQARRAVDTRHSLREGRLHRTDVVTGHRRLDVSRGLIACRATLWFSFVAGTAGERSLPAGETLARLRGWPRLCLRSERARRRGRPRGLDTVTALRLACRNFLPDVCPVLLRGGTRFFGRRIPWCVPVILTNLHAQKLQRHMFID